MNIEKKLSWKKIDLMNRLHKLEKTIQDDLKRTPPQNTRTIQKFARWLEQLQYIFSKIQSINTQVIPKVEKALGIKLKDKEQVVIALFQPSTRNLFLETKTHFYGEDIFSTNFFDILSTLSDRAELLALIGDAAISLSVIHYIWPPAEISAGSLTLQRADIVSNEHMSEICDKWELYEHRIHFDPGEPSQTEMNHDKGTLLEAIYGIIYLNYGYDKTRELVKHIL
ncbi:MAG: hypothetical protein GF411_17210 [Candidatus Lokiarchaeota archaeon]|nr:hypothetical protein [Candidatus Lokiarchaeota archaeon]